MGVFREIKISLSIDVSDCMKDCLKLIDDWLPKTQSREYRDQ